MIFKIVFLITFRLPATLSLARRAGSKVIKQNSLSAESIIPNPENSACPVAPADGTGVNPV